MVGDNTEKIIEYVKRFGKPLNQELIDWVFNNFNFQNTYQTDTYMLSGSNYLKKYSYEEFLKRLKEAATLNQGLSLISFASRACESGTGARTEIEAVQY